MNTKFEKSVVMDTYLVKGPNNSTIGTLDKQGKWRFIATDVAYSSEILSSIAQQLRHLNHQDFMTENDVHESENDFLHMYVCNKCKSSTRITNKINTIPHTSKCPHYTMSQVDVLSGKTL